MALFKFLFSICRAIVFFYEKNIKIPIKTDTYTKMFYLEQNSFEQYITDL